MSPSGAPDVTPSANLSTGPSTGPSVDFGSWPSPVTTELVLEQSSSIGELQAGATDLWWSELRPRDGGRVVVVRHRAGTGQANLLTRGLSARTRVHEYGGGAWWLHGDVLFFTNWSDQRLYRHYGDHRPEPLTPAYGEDVPARYADGRVTADGRWVVCVRELHASPSGASTGEPSGDSVAEPTPEPRNEIVAVEAHEGGEPVVLVTGPDFVSSPRLSPNGEQIVWLQWNHPDMPWDGTELWIADIDDDPDGIVVSSARRVAGSRDESICQPTWLADGSLVFVSDRTDWWNLYRVTAADALAATAPATASGDVPATLVGAVEGEIGLPQWVFGQTRFAQLEDGRLLCAVAQRGVDRLGLLDLDTDTWTWLDTSLTSVSNVVAFGSGAAVVGASFQEETAVRLLDLSDPTAPVVTVVNRTPEHPLDRRYLSVAEPIDFATTDGAQAHALYYPPVNPDVVGPVDERPPLVVLSHGGPTSAARSQLNLGIQYWTSRGIAVVDVNYRGSVGYGRTYRHALDGQWGIADVDDCIAAARFLVERGDVDGSRLAIRGGSAGGFTTLCAVTFHDVFGAGASLYGVADLEALTRDTHKFESRYLDRLIGPWPEAKARYDERSPIQHTDQLSTPLIVFQGLEDAIVPPAQAEAMVAALQAKGVPHAYLAFEGEQHGFRQAANIARVLEAELSFYGKIFGFAVDDDIEPVVIANL